MARALQTQGVYAVNCLLDGTQVKMGMVVLSRQVGVCQLVDVDTRERVTVDLSGIQTGKSLGVCVPLLNQSHGLQSAS